MNKQGLLFSDGVIQVPAKIYPLLAQHPLNKKRRPDRLLKTQTEAAYYLGIGEPYGILCRRYEGWYIRAIMAYIKQSGINAYYEKIHEKGLGFTGYIIKLKKS